jgi:hypothetical protein
MIEWLSPQRRALSLLESLRTSATTGKPKAGLRPEKTIGTQPGATGAAIKLTAGLALARTEQNSLGTWRR